MRIGIVLVSVRRIWICIINIEIRIRIGTKTMPIYDMNIQQTLALVRLDPAAMGSSQVISNRDGALLRFGLATY